MSITLIRGSVALLLGACALLHPGKTRPVLANFIGLFWLVSGALSLRWTVSRERAERLALAAGVIGVLGGLLVLGRSWLGGLLTPEGIVYLLGGVALLTGTLHMAGGFRGASVRRRSWPWEHCPLDAFEVVLGLMFLVSLLEGGPVVILAAAGWVVLGGFILMADAWRLSRVKG